jgi:membrane-bound ClpP family serine protease
MSFNWKSIVGTVAPGLATALGGPLAGMAVKAVSGALLGKQDGTEDEIAEAIAAGDTDALQKLREADQQFTISMKKLDIDIYKISSDDRDSARRREMAVKDKTPAVIALVSFLGFFGVLAALMFVEVPTGAKDSLLIMLGTLGGIVTSIVAYYYGSSAGSAAKSKAMDELLKNR